MLSPGICHSLHYHDDLMKNKVMIRDIVSDFKVRIMIDLNLIIIDYNNR